MVNRTFCMRMPTRSRLRRYHLRMRKRVLGRTGIEVSELGLGGLHLSSLGGGVDETRRILTRAHELGINYIDTAPRYADSEETLGQAMQGLDLGQNAAHNKDHKTASNTDLPFTMATKFGGRPDPFDPKLRGGLMWSIEESLKLLKRDMIDIMFIHEPDRPSQVNWFDDPFQAIGPVMDVFDELKEDGVIKYTGLGGTTTTQMAHLMRTGKFDVVLTAFNYSVLFREAEYDIFPAAKEMNMGVVVGSSLQQGGLGRRFDEVIQSNPAWMATPRRKQFLELYALLDELDMPIVEMALRFSMSNPQVHSVLTGAKTVEHIEEAALYMGRGPLPPDVLGRLDEIYQICPMRPFEEPMILPLGSTTYFGPGMANHGDDGTPEDKTEANEE